LLIVDHDGVTLREEAAFLDASFDVRVEAGSSGALRVMEDNPAAAVLVDVDLPGDFALGLVAELRRRWPATLLVCMYSNGDRFQRLEPMLRETADVFLARPLDLGRMEQALLSALSIPRTGTGTSESGHEVSGGERP